MAYSVRLLPARQKLTKTWHLIDVVQVSTSVDSPCPTRYKICTVRVLGLLVFKTHAKCCFESKPKTAENAICFQTVLIRTTAVRFQFSVFNLMRSLALIVQVAMLIVVPA